MLRNIMDNWIVIKRSIKKKEFKDSLKEILVIYIEDLEVH